jgi:hypothetical protein
VNCHTVNILLSTDGGMDFDSVLAAGTANDGAESVVVPNTATLAARIKVEAADHVFFDINNSNFQINESAGVGEPPQSAGAAAATLHAGRPNPFSRETAIAFEVSSAARVTLGVYDLRGHLVRMLLDGPVSAGRHETFWNGTDARGVAVASGVYLCELKGSSGHATQRVTILK